MDEIVPLEEARRRQQNHEASALLDLIDPICWQGQAIPPRRWIIPDWIPLRAVTLLSGDGGVGKSLIAQQLLTACATGGRWLGLDVMPCKVFGIFCEDEADELHRRQHSINDAHDIEFGDLENMLLASRVGMDNILMTFDRSDIGGRTDFFSQVVAKVRAFGAQLVVIDTAPDTFGGNEIFRNQVLQFIGALRWIALEIDGAVVLTAHPSVAGIKSGSGISGSTGWNNSVRSRLYLARAKADSNNKDDTDERILQRKKANYAGPGDEIRLEWRSGAFQALASPEGIIGSIERRREDKVILCGLAELAKQGRTASDSPNAGNYLPKLVSRMPHANGVRYRNLQRAMERIFIDELITCKEHGPPSRRQKRVEITPKGMKVISSDDFGEIR